MKIIESNIIGKKSQETCEDGLVENKYLEILQEATRQLAHLAIVDFQYQLILNIFLAKTFHP
jgi:hypothetical protein